MDKVVEILDARRLRAWHVSELRSAGEGQRRRGVGIDRRQRAQQRSRACHHDHLTADLQRVRSLHSSGDGGKISRLLIEWQVGALGEAQHLVLSQIGGQAASERHRRILARHHRKRGLRLMRESRGDHERARAVRDAQRAIVAGIEIGPESIQAFRALKREAQRIDKHTLHSPITIGQAGCGHTHTGLLAQLSFVQAAHVFRVKSVSRTFIAARYANSNHHVNSNTCSCLTLKGLFAQGNVAMASDT